MLPAPFFDDTTQPRRVAIEDGRQQGRTPPPPKPHVGFTLGKVTPCNGIVIATLHSISDIHRLLTSTIAIPLVQQMFDNRAFNADDAIDAAGSSLGADVCQPFTIIIVDPSRMTRDALCRVFRAEEPGLAFLPAGSIEEIAGTEVRLLPLLAAIRTGSRSFSSFWVRRELLLAASLGLRVAVLSDSTSRAEVMESIRLGARGYIPTDFPFAAAISAMKIIRAGEFFIPSWALQDAKGNIDLSSIAQSSGWHRGHQVTGDRISRWRILSQRELKVVQLVCMGKPNKSIGVELGIAVSTVKIHVSRIMRKLEVRNRTELCALMNGVDLQKS